MLTITAPLKRLLVVVWLFSVAVPAAAEPWLASVDTSQGLPLVTKGGVAGVKSSFVFWGANYSAADTAIQFRVVAPYTYGVTGRNATLGFDLASNGRKSAATQMTWDIDLNAAAAKSNVIGGGIAFKFDLGAFGKEMGSPAILPDNSGWSWGAVGGNRLEMRFSPLPAFIGPAGSGDEIRVLFYNGSIPAGHTVSTATLTLAGDMAFNPSLAERLGLADPTTWPADILDWRTSPVDLSFLNLPEIPAGKHGFLKTSGERLVFQDGTPVRFWGTNLAANALFATSRDVVKQQARRLSQLGFNLVRIHHHDSPWVSPNVFGGSAATNTLVLSAGSMEKLDWWIRCLRDEGIYVWLDLHTLRYLKPGDSTDYFQEMAKGKTSADLRGYNYVNPSIQGAMLGFMRDYLNHYNYYTGNRYRDEPAIVGLTVTNENDLTQHFGNSLLPDKNVPSHTALYMDRAKKFADAWGLAADATWRSWLYGPSKLFLNDLERRFDQDMLGYLRTSGSKVPIATTNAWGGMPLTSLPALTSGDLIDSHAYGSTGEIEKSPLYGATLVHWAGAAQVAGRPLTVSEWNVEAFPAPDRHGVPLYFASAARLQGWDAVMEYAYSQQALDTVNVPSNWHAYSDPGMIATLPAAALLYRQGHVRESSTVYAFAPTPSQLFSQGISAGNSIALRTAMERGKLVVVLPATRELPWLEKGAVPAGAVLITDPQETLVPGDATLVASDTGELRRNWGQGTYTINTPRTQAAMGWIGGKNIQFPDVNISVSTRYATVAVQTLDGQPVNASRSLMISLGARSIPVANRMPYYSEPVVGRLSIRAPAGLRLFKRGADGIEQELPVSYVDGSYVLGLDASLRTYWLLLK